MHHKARDSGGKYALLLLLCRHTGQEFTTSSDLKMSGFPFQLVIGFVENLLFSILESGF